MMMAQPFPAHQGMQHGMPPGHHPMAGQHPNAGHPGPGMVQQMHPGVSQPGGPQVSQPGPMMGGMPPGAGTAGPGGPVPNAHALSHLNPANAHMFQQQGFPQNFANNPQMMQQQQQAQMFRQRVMIQQQAQAQAQAQAQQQQQQQQHGLPVSLPNGTQGLNAAQMAAMQANPRMSQVNMMHLQQQIPHGQQGLSQQQMMAIQQAQQHAQQQAMANNGQPGQHTPQRTSAQPPSMHETQAGTPQSQHGALPQSGTPQPNQQSQPPSTQPPQSQGPQQAQATPNPQPQPLPQPQQPGQQQPQPGQQQQQPQQGPQGQQGQVSGPPSQQALAAQEAQFKAQQQTQAAMMMQQQQQRLNRQGQATLCLHSYAEHLGNFASRGEAPDYMFWHNFVEKFYSPGGVLRQGVWSTQGGSKQFEISTPALARFYITQYNTGIKQIQLVVEGAREHNLPNGGHIVEAPKAYFIYSFTNECRLFTHGHLRAYFDASNKIDMMDFTVTSHDEYVPRSMLQSLEASEQKQSPKATKNSGKRAQKQAQSFTLPESMVTPNGVPSGVMDFLEIAETISHMQMLFNFSQQNPNLSPPEALRNLVNTLHAQGPTAQFATPMNPGMQPVPRQPSMNGPSQFASPAMAHLGLPGAQGSPHLTGSAHASPAQSQIAGAPGMPVQPSPVINNSPNVGGNKRRRASTVKMESEDGNEVNGTGAQGATKVKASPRVPKRQKGAAS